MISSSCLYSNTQFIAQGTSIEYVEDPDNDTNEIGIPKKVYLAIFMEGHSYFQGIYPKANTLRKLPRSALEEIYFASLSLLVTTNDYSTVWRLHEEVVFQLEREFDASWIKKDFIFCTALATSRLDKINKSSMLWHWLRKLCSVILFIDFDEGEYYNFLRQILRSMESHLANYAAGFTYVWCVQVARALELNFDEKVVVTLIREKCRQKLCDTSLWTSYSQVLSGQKSAYIEPQVMQIGEQIREKSGRFENIVHAQKIFGRKSGNISISIPDLGNAVGTSYLQLQGTRELQWLLDIRCTVKSPYTQIINIIRNKEHVFEMIRETIMKETSKPSQKEFVTLLDQLYGHKD